MAGYILCEAIVQREILDFRFHKYTTKLVICCNISDKKALVTQYIGL